MRWLALLGASTIALAGCHPTRKCKSGTVLLSVELPAGTDTLQYSVSIDGVATTPQSVTLSGAPTHGTLELDFSSYPAGHMVSVTVTALGGGVALGSAMSAARTLAGGCDAITLAISAAGDAGVGDLGGDGGGGGSGDGGGVTASCAGPGDCPTGQSCDLASGTCTTSCNATQPCNGGCCFGGTCDPGTSTPSCALGQAVCGACTGNSAGSACLASGASNVCGCTSSSDCLPNQACNTTTHTCGSACDMNTLCNGGCCGSSGTCQTGTAPTICGNNGASCGDCTSNQNGHQCIAVTGGGQCGCNAIGDCPGSSTSCSTSKLCVNTCGTGMACLSGCCSSATSGTCMPGTSQTVCGAVGSTCATCVGNANGTACLSSGACGCNSATDCAVGQACDLSNHHCTTSCNASQLCNGGCCSSAGSCAVGNTTAACGASGACATCPSDVTCATYTCNGTSCVTTYHAGTQCAGPLPMSCLGAAYCLSGNPTCPARQSTCGSKHCCDGTCTTNVCE
ncbi:MAG TPA: hypothetical protein VGL86_19240 [Polyangia bacterium]